MYTLAIIFSLFITSVVGFPLQGQTWVFINGGNKNVVQSMYEFDPLKVIIIKFARDGLAEYSYANLSNKYLLSTSQALEEIQNQFAKNYKSISDKAVYKASYQPFPDEEYSCLAELKALQKTGKYRAFYINGEQVNINTSFNDWYSEEPDCYGERNYGHSIDFKKKTCVNGWCSYEDGDIKKGIEYTDVCNPVSGVCRKIIENFEEKPSASFFWNLHIFPKVVWNPKHQATGRVIKEEAYNDQEMMELREKARNAPRDENLKRYINPVLSKDESVIFSAQFVLPSSNIPLDITELNFNVQGDENQTSYYHYPPRAYKVQSFYDEAGIEKAILLPFASEDKYEWVKNLGFRCPNWKTKDKLIGESAYSIKNDLQVKISTNIPQDVSDPAWWEYKEGWVTNPDGSKEYRYERYQKDSLTGQTAIVRNVEFPYEDYWWKGCPDLPASSNLPYTKAQLKQILFTEFPKCDPKRFKDYFRAYLSMVNVFVRDSSEYEMSIRKLYEAKNFIYEFKDMEKPSTITCPETPMDIVTKRFR